MARVASPEQAAKAAQAVSGFDDPKRGRKGNLNNFSRTRPLSRFERESLRSPVASVYLYNISPVKQFEWRKDYPGLGTISLYPRKADQKYSDPVALINRLVRPYDGGNSIRRLMVETPLEIAQDFLVCSTEYPGRPENNLTKWGAFYTEGKPLEEFSTEQQQDILDKAELNHRNRCHELIAHADALYNSPNRACIIEIHKNCALYLKDVGDISELPDWVSRRAKLSSTDECKFCGFENKRGVAKCRNCQEVLNVELYKQLRKEVHGEK